MSIQNAFLEQFEKTRLDIEGRLLRLPESFRFLRGLGLPEDGPALPARHPDLTALVRILVYSHRTVDVLGEEAARLELNPT